MEPSGEVLPQKHRRKTTSLGRRRGCQGIKGKELGPSRAGGQVAGHTAPGSTWDPQKRIWEWDLGQETALSVSEMRKERPERPEVWTDPGPGPLPLGHR